MDCAYCMEFIISMCVFVFKKMWVEVVFPIVFYVIWNEDVNQIKKINACETN